MSDTILRITHVNSTFQPSSLNPILHGKKQEVKQEVKAKLINGELGFELRHSGSRVNALPQHCPVLMLSHYSVSE